MGIRVLAVFTILGQIASFQCESEHPDDFLGSLCGNLTYSGALTEGMTSPAVLASARAYDPGLLNRVFQGDPLPPPHSSYYLINPVFTEAGIPYCLEKLEPYDQGYIVMAGIVDLDKTPLNPVASGFFPDNSILFNDPGVGPVTVIAGETQNGINIALTDIP